jgi:hypothetical protein
VNKSDSPFHKIARRRLARQEELQPLALEFTSVVALWRVSASTIVAGRYLLCGFLPNDCFFGAHRCCMRLPVENKDMSEGDYGCPVAFFLGQR